MFSPNFPMHIGLQLKSVLVPEIQLDFSGPTQVLIAPWPLPPPLRKSEPRAKMEELIQTTVR